MPPKSVTPEPAATAATSQAKTEVFLKRLDALQGLYLHMMDSMHRDLTIYSGAITVLLSVAVGFLAVEQRRLDQTTAIFLAFIFLGLTGIGGMAYTSLLAHVRRLHSLGAALNEMLWYLSADCEDAYAGLCPLVRPSVMKAISQHQRSIPATVSEKGVGAESCNTDQMSSAQVGSWGYRLRRFAKKWLVPIPAYRHLWFLAIIAYNTLCVVMTVSWVLRIIFPSGYGGISSTQAPALEAMFRVGIFGGGVCAWVGTAAGLLAYLLQVLGSKFFCYRTVEDWIAPRRKLAQEAFKTRPVPDGFISLELESERTKGEKPMFTYDKSAVREIVRFILLGLFLGLVTGFVYGVVSLFIENLWAGLGLVVLNFLALWINARVAKTLYWTLAVLLEIVGFVHFGLLGAVIGLGLWFLVLSIVPALRYVLQRDNIISILCSSLLVWLATALIWQVSWLDGGRLVAADLWAYALLGLLVGGVFWGIAKIISSCFKEYHYRKDQTRKG